MVRPSGTAGLHCPGGTADNSPVIYLIAGERVVGFLSSSHRVLPYAC